MNKIKRAEVMGEEDPAKMHIIEYNIRLFTVRQMMKEGR
jgi:hypothetical protein